MRVMSEFAWDRVVSGLISDRLPKPRSTGITMVIDTGVGLRGLEDVLELAGHCIDHWKFAFGTSAFHRRKILERKLAMLAEHAVLTFPGGTLLEAAIVERHCRDYMAHARKLGFTAVEISDGTIPMPAFRRRNIIRCAQDSGLIPITEVGKKDPACQPSAREVADQAIADLEHGARWVVIEGRESGRSVGIFDQEGRVIEDAVHTINGALGPFAERLIWEAPLKEQQAYLITKFGTNVGLGNVHPDQILPLEALRCRLRFDTMQPVTENLRHSGAWDPQMIEPKRSAVPVKIHVVENP
jgi:phosphosulfolactate synthase